MVTWFYISNNNAEITIKNEEEEVLVSTSDFSEAGLEYQEQIKQYVIQLSFEKEGMLEEITQRHTGEKIHFYLNEELISSPMITTPISDTNFIVTGDYSEETAEKIVETINTQ